MLVAVALAATLVTATIGALRTPWGAERLRRFALNRINATISGRLELQRFWFGGDRVALAGIVLRDPQGIPVVHVDRLDVSFSALALLRRRIVVRAMVLDGLALDLRRGNNDADATWNIARAVAPRQQRATRGSSGKSGSRSSDPLARSSLIVDRLAIRDASVEVRDERPSTVAVLRHLRADAVDLDGNATFDGPAGTATVTLGVRGNLVAPQTEPIAVTLHLDATRGTGAAAQPNESTGDTNLEGRLELVLGKSVASARLHVLREAEISSPALTNPDPPNPLSAPEPALRLAITLERLVMTPALIQLLAPESPVRASVSATGAGSWDSAARRAAGHLDVQSAGAALTLRGSADFRLQRIDGISVQGRHINLARLIVDGPPSDLGFDLYAHGSGDDLKTLRGALDLTVPAGGKLGGQPLGPIRLRANADRGRYTVMDLAATLPGVLITGAGDISARRLSFRGDVKVRDLGVAVASLTAGSTRQNARVAGVGRVGVRLSGTPAAPAVRLDGEFNGLTWRNLEAARLLVTAQVTDARHAREVRTVLEIPEARIGKRRLAGLQLRARITDDDVAGQLVVRLPEPVDLQFDVGWRKQRQSTRARADRVAGRVDLGVAGARIAGRFDVPLSWPPPPRTPVALDFSASRVDLARLITTAFRLGAEARSTGAPSIAPPAAGADESRTMPGTMPPWARSLRGQGAFSLQVSGTGADPRVEARAQINGLGSGRTSLGDLSLALDAASRDGITARVQFRPPAAPRPSDRSATAPPSPMGGFDASAPASVELRTRWTLAELAKDGFSVASLMRADVHIQGAFDDVALGPVALLFGYRPAVQGTASLRLSMNGPLGAPRGEGLIRIAGLASGRFPATDAELRLAATGRDLRAHCQVTRRNSTLLLADAQIDTTPGGLADREKLVNAPLALHILFGPFAVQRLGLPPQSDRNPPRVLRARLRTELQVVGTARHPRATARVDASNIRIDKAPIGIAEATISYEDTDLRGDIKLTSPNQGTLRLVTSTRLDLGYPQVLRPPDPRQISLAGQLDAQGFDLSGFSGAARQLRSVGGQLFAAARITGTAADPLLSGRLEWKDGLLAVTGIGDYRNVHLLVRGDAAHLTLDELRADSGGGHARITGAADHGTGQGYRLKAVADLSHFPVYSGGQALAEVSLQGTGDGQVSVSETIGRVSLTEAHIELSETKRREVQGLARPSDVVLVQGGAPLNDAQAKKLSMLMASRQAAARSGGARDTGRERPRGSAPATTVVSVVAPRNLWVKGKDANLEVGLGPGFRVEGSDGGLVYGDVIVRRGRVDVVGRRFDIKEGSNIHFSGPADFPELDINAQHVNEKENITVLVTVKGTPGHLQTSITAPDRPDLSETQLYTMIVTGRLDFGGSNASSTTTSDRAASLLGGLMASQLQKVLAKKLPFDVLTIEADDGLSRARLEAGTYVTSELYVGYVGNLRAEPALLQNRNAVHLEYALTSRWSFEGEYGDAKTGTADVIWTKRY